MIDLNRTNRHSLDELDPETDEYDSGENLGESSEGGQRHSGILGNVEMHDGEAAGGLEYSPSIAPRQEADAAEVRCSARNTLPWILRRFPKMQIEENAHVQNNFPQSLKVTINVNLKNRRLQH